VEKNLVAFAVGKRLVGFKFRRLSKETMVTIGFDSFRQFLETRGGFQVSSGFERESKSRGMVEESISSRRSPARLHCLKILVSGVRFPAAAQLLRAVYER
jgi:hypothetical protein